MAHWLVAVLAVAVANAVAGRLGLSLAIAPGFATAVFPPSGVALAALLLWGTRLWPGVWLGSFAFNLHLALGSSPEATLIGAAPVAASIAVGSTLQACLGVWLVRRLVGSSNAFVHERDIFAFVLIGGPASCVLAASWGVATLSLAGLIQPGETVYTWFTWWVGDAIGVLIFAPLVMASWGQPRSIWRPRLLSVGAPLCIAFALVVMVYSLVSAGEQQSLASRFRRLVETPDRALRSDLDAYAEVLWSIRSYYAGSQNVDEDEFQTFVQRSLSAYPGLRAVSFNARVRGRERADYEAGLRRGGLEDFVIGTRDASGALVPAEPREEHVVVHYIEPRQANAGAIGFDVLGDPVRRRALERARDTGEPTATEQVTLVQSEDRSTEFLIFLPIYDTDATPPTLALRRATLRGFAAAAVRVDRLVEASLEGLPASGFELSLWDEAAPTGRRFLGRFPRDASPPPPGGPIEALEVSRQLEVGARPWTVRFVPTPGYLALERSWQPWVVLAGGLTFAGLLGVLLLVITGRTALESERLQEVARVNQRLELTNEELARFAYAASHDLKSPLNGIARLASFLRQDCNDALPEQGREYLAMIQTRIDRMGTLLEDLLQFSRVGWLEQEPETIDTGDLVQEILSLLPEASRFTVSLVGMQTISTFRVPLAQVMRNLLDNAIKHHDRGHGRIEVGCRDAGDQFEFCVRDDGPGVPEKHHERVFEMFQRLQTRDGSEGSGMGLALVRKIVANRGGEVAIESDGGRGTTIRFTWPKSIGSESAA